MYCTPSTVVAAEVRIEDATEYRRRVARSLKNESQVSFESSDPALAEEEVELTRCVIRDTDGITVGLECGREHI